MFLGVPEREVAGQAFTHHQLLQDYSRPLGNGNNMFISVSSPGDTESAPPGCRAVMISTHCELDDWEGLSPDDYAAAKAGDGRTVAARWPAASIRDLGRAAAGLRSGHAADLRAVHPPAARSGRRLPPDTGATPTSGPCRTTCGVPGFWLAGDTTWPGLGTVACVLGSRLVAEAIVRELAVRSRRSVDQAPDDPLDAIGCRLEGSSR